MFDYDDSLRILEDFPKMKEKKQQKVLKNLMFDDSFIEWLFQPKPEANITEKVNAMYIIFTKPKVVRSLADMISDIGYNEFGRSHATFLYSICNIAIQSNNDRIIEINRQRKNNELSSKEAQEILDKVEKYNKYIAELLRCVKKIVKRDAKQLARDAHLPKNVCSLAFHSVPEPKYVDRYRIGYYLNNLLNDIYSEVDATGGFENETRWKPFFKTIFGNDNIIEAATFILLEGVHRIDKYDSSKQVRACWDSLTTFALKELNDAPDALRSQMLELYIKRIDKMFSNKAFDLRVNLLSVDDNTFPKLVDSISKYADKIQDILKRGA